MSNLRTCNLWYQTVDGSEVKKNVREIFQKMFLFTELPSVREFGEGRLNRF